MNFYSEKQYSVIFVESPRKYSTIDLSNLFVPNKYKSEVTIWQPLVNNNIEKE